MTALLKKILPTKPFAHNGRLLREMPWLWAIRPQWSAVEKIKVTRFSHQVNFLDYWISGGQPEASGTCYIHLVEENFEKVEAIRLEGHPLALYDALEDLRKREVNLNCVRHMVTLVGNETRVWDTTSDTSFEQLFLCHPRSHARVMKEGRPN